MKRQFVHIRSIQGHRDSEQASMSGQWSPVTMQGEAAPAGETPQSQVLSRPQTGLLSSWRAGNEGLSLSGFDAQTAQMGVAPVVTHEPVTYPNYRQASLQGFVPGEVSPYESGVRPLPSPFPFAGVPVQESPSLQSLPDSRPLAPLDVQPFPRPPIWPSMSQGYQSGPSPTTQPMGFYAAPPPVVQPLVSRGQEKATRRKNRFPIWVRVVASLLLVLLILTGVGIGYYQVTFAGHISNITGQKAASIVPKDQEGNANQATTTGGNSLGSQRINILLLGSDNDEKFFAPLAQTDIVVTIDPATNYVGMLSIPRDLWINVPGQGQHKLDEAFAYGWQYVHQGPTPFSNAVGLSIATIEQDFGIPITHYAWVGLNGFIKVIDTAGGVDIDAMHPMTDDIYPNDVNTNDPYGYKRLYIAPGPQHMDGLHALEYVRTRHSDLVGDFGRSARQQQVLSQLKTKLATPGIINQLPELTKDLDGYVKTDMDLPGIINLMGFARNIDPNKVDRLVLSPPYSTSFTAPNGADAFKPVCGLILPQIARMFALGNNARCDVQADTNSSSLLASSGTISSAAVHATNAWQTINQAAQVTTLSLQHGNGDLFGVRSLLDLLFLVVFESFDAVKV